MLTIRTIVSPSSALADFFYCPAASDAFFAIPLINLQEFDHLAFRTVSSDIIVGGSAALANREFQYLGNSSI